MMWYFTCWDDVNGEKCATTLHVFDSKEQALTVFEDLNQFHTCSVVTEVPGSEISVGIGTQKLFFYGAVITNAKQ